jgi:hypothetical protein
VRGYVESGGRGSVFLAAVCCSLVVDVVSVVCYVGREERRIARRMSPRPSLYTCTVPFDRKKLMIR